jgi:hypothetical protein
MNIVLGIIGAAVASWMFGLLLYMYARACVTPGVGVLDRLNIAATPAVSLQLDDPRPAQERLPRSWHWPGCVSSTPQLKREQSRRPEFGRIPGNPYDLSKR